MTWMPSSSHTPHTQMLISATMLTLNFYIILFIFKNVLSKQVTFKIAYCLWDFKTLENYLLFLLVIHIIKTLWSFLPKTELTKVISEDIHIQVYHENRDISLDCSL